MVRETMDVNDWTCPDCGKLLCGDGFAPLERKIEVHMETCGLKEAKDG